MDKTKYVLKIGGSLFFDENLNLRQSQIEKFTQVLKKSQIVGAVVVGGGKLARTYINAARSLNSDEADCDSFGIGVSRLNSKLLISALKERAFPEPITTVKEARVNSLWGRIIVAGGFIPGQSTTSVTFEIAESIGASNVLILTNVDGIYDKDPGKFADAKKIDEITIKDLEELIYGQGGSDQSAAGEYRILDAVSFQIMKRSNLNVRLMGGEDITGLERILIKEDPNAKIGTTILRK